MIQSSPPTTLTGERNLSLGWAAATLVILTTAVSLQPVAVVSVALICVLLVLGFRYPVAVAAFVLIAIPIVDQAIAETEFTEIFGAFRLTPSVALKGMMSLVVITFLVRERINPLAFPVLRPLLIWLGYTGVTCLTFHDRSLAFSMWLRLAYWTLYFVFFYAVAAQNNAVRNRSVDLRVLWSAGLIAGLIFTGSVFAAKLLGIGGDYYGVGESYGFYADPWNMAMTLPGVLVLTLMYSRLWGSSGRVRLLCTVVALITLFASYLTFTRTSLIASLIAFIVFACASRHLRNTQAPKRSSVLALVVLLVIAGLLAPCLTSKSARDQAFARWYEVDKGDIGSGRLQVFYAAWTKFVNASAARKIIGHGIGAGPEAAEEFMGVYVYLHDDALEMLVCAGVLGLVLYAWSFLRMYGQILSGLGKKDPWAVAGLLALAVYNLTSISYMRIYAVTPNTYFALVAGTSLGALHATGLSRLATQGGTCTS